jgi:micrococcal nuclease
VSRHWKPEIVTSGWTRASAYRRRGHGAWKVALLLVGAVAVGLAAGWLMQPKRDDAAGKPDAPIEWHKVQAVPTRALSPEEVEWEKRGDEPVIASPEGARQSSPPDAAEEQTGLPRGSAARNDALVGATGRLYVIDGDTFGIGEHRIRIANIDAPETHPSRCPEEARLGLAATQKLHELLSRGAVTMSAAGRDRYGRELRYVQVDGQDVGETMIAAGSARSYSGGKKLSWC